MMNKEDSAFSRKWLLTVTQSTEEGLIESYGRSGATAWRVAHGRASSRSFGTAGEALEHYYTVALLEQNAEDAENVNAETQKNIRLTLAKKAIAIFKTNEEVTFIDPESWKIKSLPLREYRRIIFELADKFGDPWIVKSIEKLNEILAMAQHSWE